MTFSHIFFFYVFGNENEASEPRCQRLGRLAEARVPLYIPRLCSTLHFVA